MEIYSHGAAFNWPAWMKLRESAHTVKRFIVTEWHMGKFALSRERNRAGEEDRRRERGKDALHSQRSKVPEEGILVQDLIAFIPDFFTFRLIISTFSLFCVVGTDGNSFHRL